MYSSTWDKNASRTRLSNLGFFRRSSGLAGGGLVLALVFVIGRGWWRTRTFEAEAIPRIKEAIAARYNQQGREACRTANCRARFVLLRSEEVEVALHHTPGALRLAVPVLDVDVPFYYLVKDKDGEGVAVMAPPDDEERRRRRRSRTYRRRSWRVRHLLLDTDANES